MNISMDFTWSPKTQHEKLIGYMRFHMITSIKKYAYMRK